MKPEITQGVVALLKNEFGINAHVAHGTSGISFKKGDISECAVGAAAAVVAIRQHIEKVKDELGPKNYKLLQAMFGMREDKTVPDMVGCVILAMPACCEDVGDQVTVF